MVKGLVTWRDNKHVILNRNSVKGLPTDCRALNMDVVAEEIEKDKEKQA